MIIRPPVASRRTAVNPAVVFVSGFAAVILVGAAVLMLPVSSASGEWTGVLDALFTATSAVCVTGLVVVDTSTYWSVVGQVVILALFQVGGVGFMTSATVLLLLSRRRMTLRQRLLLREALGTRELGSVLTLARNIMIFTLVVEGIGAAILTLRFLGDVDLPRAAWWGVFHAVSGFNNAGFDLFGPNRSLTDYSRSPLVLLPIAALFLVGSLSYTVVEDVVRHRRFVALALDTKIVLVTTAGLTGLGTLALLFTERANPGTFGEMDPATRLLNAFFQTVSRTAGFSSVDIGAMTEDGLFVLMGLMFIGGSAASTSGGIKVQTFGLLFFAIIAAVRGLDHVEAFRRRVPTSQVFRALSIALLSIAVVFVVALALNVAEHFVFHRVLFEAISALATVGYSTGITPDTTPAGRILLICSMFVGRLGPLTLVLALAARTRRATHGWAEESIKIG